MKIAFCIFKYFPYGGLQRDFLYIATECHNRGHEVVVYTTSWEGDIPFGLNVSIVPVKSLTNYGQAIKFSKWIKQEIKEVHFDSIVGFNRIEGLNIYFAGDNCYLLKGHRSRNFLYRFLPRFKMFVHLEKSIFKASSNTDILILTERQKYEYRSCYLTQDERFYLLPPGITPDRKLSADFEQTRAKIRKSLDLSPETNVILQVGSGFITKGVLRSLTAIAALPQNIRSNLVFLVAGRDDIPRYENLIKKLGIQNNVRFLGGVSNIMELMLASDLMIHPAVDEATGTVLIEAMAAGLPVICSGICGYSRFIKDADYGRVIPEPFSQSSFNRTLLNLITENNSLQIMKNNAIAYTSKVDIYSRFKCASDIIEKCSGKVLLTKPTVL